MSRVDPERIADLYERDGLVPISGLLYDGRGGYCMMGAYFQDTTGTGYFTAEALELIRDLDGGVYYHETAANTFNKCIDTGRIPTEDEMRSNFHSLLRFSTEAYEDATRLYEILLERGIVKGDTSGQDETLSLEVRDEELILA